MRAYDPFGWRPCRLRSFGFALPLWPGLPNAGRHNLPIWSKPLHTPTNLI